jgi:hypothetical protein
MPISAISSASGTVLAERAIANLSEPKKMEQTAASPAVPTTKRISVADSATAKSPATQPTTTLPSTKAYSDTPPTNTSGMGGHLDIKA